MFKWLDDCERCMATCQHLDLCGTYLRTGNAKRGISQQKGSRKYRRDPFSRIVEGISFHCLTQWISSRPS